MLDTGKTYLYFYIVLCSIFLQLKLGAAYPSYENIYVNDWANLLDHKAEEKITEQLKTLRANSQVEITLVTINKMSDYANTKDTIEAFALDLFNQWGVGDSEKNDGVLVLVSRFDRKMRIATGRAYDDTRLNSIAKAIIEHDFIPSFKRDNYQKGIIKGMERVIQTFNPNSNFAIGFMDSTHHAISNTSQNAWYELKQSPFLLFLLFISGIGILNLIKVAIKRLFTSKQQKETYYIRPNYLVDEQPKAFKQTFPDEKSVDKKRFVAAFFLGLILLLFTAAFIGFNFAKVAFLILLGGLGLSYGVAEFFIQRRNKAKVCPRCNNAMFRLSEVKDDEHLELPERVEESLKSVDYDVWLCSDCQRTKKLSYPYWFTSIKECKQCEYQTLEIDVNTIRSATTSSEGLEEIIEDCKYCDFHHEYEQIIPKESESSSNSSGSSSFGGGSSSGGGASGSW